MNQFDNIVFKNKTFGNLLEEIYENQKKKDKQVAALIKELQPMIEEIGDATLIVPLIKEYMEIGVKNDDILVKMAALVQRSMNSQSNELDFGISDKEKQQLLDEVNKFKSEE